MKLKLASHHIRRASVLGVGIAEQAVSSATMFVFVMLLASVVGAENFGLFSIAWSFIMLMESLLWGLFGDAVPAIANKLPHARWPQFRTALYVWSAIISGVLVLVGVIVGAGAIALGYSFGWLIAVSACASFAMRMQQLFRRLCFLDNRRGLALLAAMTFSGTIFSSLYLLHFMGLDGPVLGMVSLTLASSASSVMVFLRSEDFARPTAQMRRWTIKRCWASGKWLIASSFSFWLSNIGLIPLAGALYGATSSGTLRLLQNFLSPLSQLNAAVLTVILPSAAAQLKGGKASKAIWITGQSIALFSSFSVIYGICITTFGAALLLNLVNHSADGITTALVAVMAISGIADSVRQGAAVPLYAMNQTRAFFFSRTASIVVMLAVLPITASTFGNLAAVVTAMAISNISATIALLVYLYRLLRPKQHG